MLQYAKVALVLVLLMQAAATPIDGSSRFNLSFPSAGPLDWLTGAQTCQSVQVTDTVQTFTGSYSIDWGDGSTVQTVQASVGQHMAARHTYSQPGMYTVLITVFDASHQQTGYFFLGVDATDSVCSAKLFAQYAGFIALILAVSVGLVAVLLRSKPNRLLSRALLLTALVWGIVAVIAYVYVGRFWFPGL